MTVFERKLRIIEDTKSGNISYTTTLPKRFCDDNNLDKGDPLYFKITEYKGNPALLVLLKEE